MAWVTPTTGLEDWKIIISQTHAIAQLLSKSAVLLKVLHPSNYDTRSKTEVKAYVLNNQDAILSDLIKTILEGVNENGSPSRKQMMLQSLELISCMIEWQIIEWSEARVRRYVHLIFKYFLLGCKGNSVSHHGYLQTLMAILMRRELMGFLRAALEEEQKIHRIIQGLFEHIHKLSVANCLEQMLLVDMKHPDNLSPPLKTHILNLLFLKTASYLSSATQDNEDAVQNVLQLLAKFFTFFDIFYDCQLICSAIQSQIEVIINLATQAPNNQIRLKSLTVIHQMEKRVKSGSIELKMIERIEREVGIPSVKSLLERVPLLTTLINRFLSLQAQSIEAVYLTRCFICCFTKRSNKFEGLLVFMNSGVILEIFRRVTSQPRNNIYAAAAADLVAIVFNWAINENCMKVNYKLQAQFLLHMYESLTCLQAFISGFKHFSNPLFHISSKICKTVRFFSRDFLGTYTETIQPSQDLLKVLEKAKEWKNFTTFIEYQNWTATSLGDYAVETEPEPTQFTVVKAYQNKATAVISLTSSPKPNAAAIEAALTSSINIISDLNVSKGIDEIKLVFSPRNEKHRQQISPLKPLTSLQANNQEELEESYETFKKKKMGRIAEQIQPKRPRSVSRMKSSEQKKVSRWAGSPKWQSSEKAKQKGENTKMEKIHLIRLRKWQLPKKYVQREVTVGRDRNLIQWLSIRV